MHIGMSNVLWHAELVAFTLTLLHCISHLLYYTAFHTYVTTLNIGMSNVPWHAEVVAFSKEVAALVSVEFRA